MKRRETIRWIALTGILAAIEIVFQIIGNIVAFGPISINLSLIPIAVGSIILGPICGLFLGLVNGVCVILSPSTLAIFMPLTAFGTIVTCLLKGMASGLVSGLVFLPFKNKKSEIFGMILASLLIPVINTGLFVCGALIFFRSWLESGGADFPNIYAFLFLGAIGWNFIFEFATSAILSPTICKVSQIVKRKHV